MSRVIGAEGAGDIDGWGSSLMRDGFKYFGHPICHQA